MYPDDLGGTAVIIIQSLLIGIICLMYNKYITYELAKIFTTPLKWLWGGKMWVTKLEYCFLILMRVTLYGGVLISLLAIFVSVQYYLVTHF